MTTQLLTRDLEHVLNHTRSLWEAVRHQHIFITGGTGFFGCWLLESFIWANDHLNLNAKATVLTRHKSNFEKKCPHLFNHPALDFIEGDVRNFTFPEGHYSHIIHAATDASVKLNLEDPLLMFDTILEGTRRTLEFARHCGAKQYLLTSSGAVYGKQPSHITHLIEDHPCQPIITDAKSAYAIGKGAAEHMSCLYGKKYQFEVKIARCFAFIGPYLPLDIHYAIGNFIRDSLKGGPIVVNGDGTPYRSYLYAADLAIWLWTILFKGNSFQPYNVGSAEDYTIGEIANIVAKNFDPAIEVKIMQEPRQNVLPERYVPDITRIEKELQLTPTIGLNEALQLTKQWYVTGQR